MSHYMALTTKRLIEMYADEVDRINQKDRETTQSLIKEELRRRFETTLKLLDDVQEQRDPTGIYRYLLNNYEGWAKTPGSKTI